MKKRYFKATDGRLTVFRSSPTMVYRSATITDKAISFHTTAADAHSARVPALEIDGSEYRDLQARKFARQSCEGMRLRGLTNSPQESYVRNGIDIPV